MKLPIASSLVVAAALLQSGCVIAPAHPYYRGGPYASVPGPVVDAPPPPAQSESPPPPPAAGYVWIGGHWGWHLGRHVWIGGRWMLPPVGHAWVPGYWGRYDRGWRWSGDYWRRH